MQFAATLFFILRRKSTDGAILLKKLYVSRSSNIQWWQAEGQVYFFMHDVTKMETVSQPTLFRSVHFFYCNQGIFYIWMCMHCSLLFIRHVVECIRQNHPLPMSQSIKMPCMRQPLYARTTYIIRPKKHLRMQDSTGPIALYLQVSFHVCCLTLLTNLLYEWIRSYD